MPFDKRMWAADITGSQKYAAALAKCGIISAAERDALVSGLEKVRGITLSELVSVYSFSGMSSLGFGHGRWQVRAEWAAGAFAIQASDEDIHTANERRLGELVGAVAGKLHTGRRQVRVARGSVAT